MQLALKVELICARANANEREGHHGTAELQPWLV